MSLEGEYAPLAQPISDVVERWERSGGREGTTLESGEPFVIMVNRDAENGLLVRTPLMQVTDGSAYVVVGSKTGGPKNPGWVANVRANPTVEVWDGPDRGEYIARELEGDERDAWWDRAIAAFPRFVDYEQATTERVFPVFLLEPIT